MRLVIRCNDCARQYHGRHEKVGNRFLCACGEILTVSAPHHHDAAIVRCSACGGTRQGQELECRFCQASFTIHEQDLHTMCGACLSRVSERAKFCHHCGTSIAPELLACKPSTRTCPACTAHHSLVHRSFGHTGVATLECHHCAGLWLGLTTFQQLVALNKQQYPLGSVGERRPKRQSSFKQAGPLYRRCVECEHMMHRTNYQHSGIIIDICRDHGIWFDAHELTDIMRWLQFRGTAADVDLAPRKRSPTPATHNSSVDDSSPHRQPPEEQSLLITLLKLASELLLAW